MGRCLQEVGVPVFEGSCPVGYDEVVDAVIAASRALVGVAARSLGGMGDEVTLPQYRALVLLASRGPQRVADLAALLAVGSSTVSRQCDRLVRKGLVTRSWDEKDRRATTVGIAEPGRALVAAVTARRRAEVSSILAHLPRAEQLAMVAALRAFADAAGEVPEQDWALGWGPT